MIRLDKCLTSNKQILYLYVIYMVQIFSCE
jgi:hypothetical protein